MSDVKSYCTQEAAVIAALNRKSTHAKGTCRNDLHVRNSELGEFSIQGSREGGLMVVMANRN
jgi:hypothetical protein